jgi:serine/threonine-protein kinase HipA
LQYLAGQDINEHLCLVAARNLGLDAAYSEVAEFDGERAIVLERYDRELVDGEVVRIHQEDFCQALSINPVDKYERGDPGQQGRGPGIVQMIETMRAVQSTEDFLSSAEHYVKALAYNWLIYAPDAHAKNYSILLDGVEVLPSPLYDISSVLPYPGAGEHEFELRTMATAISVNGKYQNNLILGSDWLALADKLRLDRNKVIGWVRDIAEQVPDAFSDAAESNRQFVGTSSVVTKLVDGVARYTQALRENIAEC